MKRFKQIIIVFILILLSTISKSQVNFNVGLGYTTNRNLSVLHMGVGYQYNNLFINGEIRHIMYPNIPEGHNFFGGRLGYNILQNQDLLNIVPSIGYYADRYNSDQKIDQSTGRFGYSLDIIRNISYNETAAYWGNIFYCNHILEVSVGIRVKIILKRLN